MALDGNSAEFVEQNEMPIDDRLIHQRPSARARAVKRRPSLREPSRPLSRMQNHPVIRQFCQYATMPEQAPFWVASTLGSPPVTGDDLV